MTDTIFEAALDPDRLPAPIAHAVRAMLEEIAINGEAASADELAKAIEATIAHLGRLWVAEYLEALSVHPSLPTPDLNAEVLERLGGGRELLTGAWLALARRTRARFLAVNAPTIVAGLAQADPGSNTAATTPLALLLEFRNNFAHGSFLASVPEIRTHRELLFSLLNDITGLTEQPAIFRDVESGVWFEATGAGRTVATPNLQMEAGHPLIIGRNGGILPLYPLLSARRTPRVELTPPDGKRLSAGLRSHPALAIWLDRYERERQGDLFDKSAYSTLDPSLAAMIQESLGRDGLVLVEARPGSEVRRVIAALGSETTLCRPFAAVGRLTLVQGDVTQSGLSVGRALLRLVERALGEREGGRVADVRTLLAADGPLATALDQLKAAGKRVLLAIGDLHSGLAPYRGEPVTVRDLWSFLAGRPVTVVATAWTGSLGRVVFDRRLSLPDQAPSDGDELQRATRKLVTTPRHRRVLETLLDATREGAEASTLFALCDRLDSGGGEPVFEPAIERALWDLEPLLRWRRGEPEPDGERPRLWSVFHIDAIPPIRSALSTETQS